ncbi:MAG: FAD-dependent oxidoreductase [Bacteroidota bacterium]
MSNHVIAIFGGAVSGAEAAAQLSERGFQVIVFEQNALPYGKIEDGLPKWHVRLRDKEEGRINEKMMHPNVTYVPNVKLGEDVVLEDVANNWGFSAVLLATGAWKDRPLPVEGVDEYINKGLYYQNPFIYWFNHYHEPDYDGQQYEIHDDAIVVGGGLASIDIVKALMMLSVKEKLHERGINTNVLELDRGIVKYLEKKEIRFEDLGIKGCTLYYRRRIKDMPLSPMDKSTPEKLAKAHEVQEKILNFAASKFLFKVAPLHVPVGKIVENDRLAGLVFQETKIEDGKVKAIEGSEKEVRSPLVISSIGSLPEPIPGIPMEWNMFVIDDEKYCQVEGYDNVFALGNAVTGRGNIKESRNHGKDISEAIIDRYLYDQQGLMEEAHRNKESVIAEEVAAIAEKLEALPAADSTKVAELYERVAMLQKGRGYTGNFEDWVRQHLPKRLEDIVGH